MRDTNDPNPLYRGLAINTLFNIPSIMEQGISRIQPALEDASAYVRRTAVSCTVKLSQFHPSVTEELNLADKLYSMIKDQDPIVVPHCLCSLDEILRLEGGITVNKKMANYLLKQVPTFENWGIIRTLLTLASYQPKTVDDTLTILNGIDPYLTSNSIAVQLSAFALFQHVAQDSLGHLLREAIARVWSKLSILLSFCEQEMLWNILDWVEQFSADYPDIFRPYYRSLYSQFSDSPALKAKKIKVLATLVDKENIMAIADEVLGHCTNQNRDVSKYALQSLVVLLNQNSAACEVFLSQVLPLLNLSDEVLVTDVLSAVCNLRFHSTMSSLQDTVLEAVTRRRWTLMSVDAKCSLIDFISEHGQNFSPSVYILEDYIENIQEEDASVKHSLLSATLRLYFQRPAEMQHLLGVVFDTLCNDVNPFVQAQASYYYKLLLENAEVAKQLVLGNCS